jgi:hypothetical protein
MTKLEPMSLTNLPLCGPTRPWTTQGGPKHRGFVKGKRALALSTTAADAVKECPPETAKEVRVRG